MTSRMTTKRTTRRAGDRQRYIETVLGGRAVRSPNRPAAVRAGRPEPGAVEPDDLAHKLHPTWTCWA